MYEIFHILFLLNTLHMLKALYLLKKFSEKNIFLHSLEQTHADAVLRAMGFTPLTLM